MVICERFVNSRFTSNTYIIACSEHDNVWIVDPGDTEVVFEWMQNHSKTIVSGIILTHGHFDHIYGINNLLSRFPSCPVYVANAFGKEVLSDPKKNGSKYTEEGPIAINKDASIDIYPQEMELWEGVPLKVHYTPGHSDDSVCLQVEGMLFTGDTLILGIKTVTKLPTGSVEKLKDTMSIIGSFYNRDYTVCAGHGEKFKLKDN